MTSERVQRQIDRLLDEAEQAAAARDWATVKERAEHALTFDPENADAKALRGAAERGLAAISAPASEPTPQPGSPAPVPASFANGRYQVRRFLGEGGKKKVYLAHDSLLDRDVAFALIKTEGLDQAARERITREAQAMGRLGDHPNIVTVYDIGDEAGQPYLVLPLLPGGDIEGLIEKAEDHKLPMDQTVRIATETCQGLEFAHNKGIVHRDIKPGNVWLAEDGRAKIGDFGLAVAVGRSRLTQAGMMVGTVSYMPPEQAMGGEVGPRSDLYSLGAMLYEMVCGRPPFVGDDYVAIISQHLNTPPVAPSWHRSDLPQGLEVLILRLLEKDPAKRPSSAAEVLEALQAIDLSAPVASPSGTNPLERVARGVFVGRERELSRLRAGWDDAFAGRGGVVMLVGEPGIGKTRTAQEVETYARIRGGQVLWGRAHEAAGAPSYWPWVQAIRSYTASTEPEALRAQLGAGATEVARIVSEVRERLPELPQPSPITDPEQAHFRLFDAVSSFLRNASTATPLLVILDDLHWADRPTLLLLQHLAGEIGRSRLLLLGSYRDVEVGRQHPLAEVLAELNREQLFQRILLRGLSREEVEQYIRASASFDPARGLLESIYQETEGNPFFLSEVLALMAQEGTLGVRGATAVPQGVREVLGRRLDRLSPECNELLGLAAIVGREFTFERLAALAEHDEERLLELVEEALKGRVVEETERAGEYRFSHALIQETLLGELSTMRRVRLHGRVAETMETHYGDQSERHAAELALHFSESATLTRSHARQAAHYSRLAGEQAEAGAGWGEAARHYRRVLALIEETREDLGQDEAALTLRLACCERTQRELGDAHNHFRRAMELWRARGDATGVARALAQATETLTFHDSLAPGEAERLAKDALDSLGDRDPYLRATLLARLCTWTMDEALFREAEEIAERLGYVDVEAELLVAKRASLLGNCEFEQGLQAALRLKTIWEQAGNRPRVGEALYYIAAAKVHLSLDAGEAAANEALAFATTFRLRTWELGATLILETIAFLRGDLSERDSPVLAVSRESAGFRLGRIALNLRAFRREASGDPEGALAVLPDPDQVQVPDMRATVFASMVRLQSHAGQMDAATRSFASYQQASSGAISPQLSVFSVPEIFFDDALTFLADEEFVEKVYRLMQSQPHVNFLVSAAIGLDHIRGVLALRLGLVDEAEVHYRVGLEWAEHERAVLEEGRCLQGLAAVAEVRGDKQTQAEHLDRAATIFQRIGANLFLKQVLAKKDVLKA